MGGRPWLNEAARRVMEATHCTDPRLGMEQLARDVLREVGSVQPPIDVTVVASFQCVRRILPTMMSHAGRLIPCGDHFLIQVNANHSRRRQRFTIAHEVGHILLATLEHHPCLIEDTVAGRYPATREEEWLCDIAAAELLMPTDLIVPWMQGHGDALAQVLMVAEQFDISRTAAAIRLVQRATQPCAMGYWQFAYKPTELRLQTQAACVKKLRLQYYVQNETFRQAFHPHLAASPNGVLVHCYQEGRTVEGIETLTIKQRQIPFRVIATAIEYQGDDMLQRDVLSLFFPA